VFAANFLLSIKVLGRFAAIIAYSKFEIIEFNFVKPSKTIAYKPMRLCNAASACCPLAIPFFSQENFYTSNEFRPPVLSCIFN